MALAKKKTGAISKKVKSTPAPSIARPKGPLSSFMYYMKENREHFTLAEAAKEKRFRKSAKKAGGNAWKKLEDKSKWEKMAAADRERYQQEMAKYTPVEEE